MLPRNLHEWGFSVSLVAQQQSSTTTCCDQVELHAHHSKSLDCQDYQPWIFSLCQRQQAGYYLAVQTHLSQHLCVMTILLLLHAIF